MTTIFQKLDSWMDVLKQEIIDLRVNQHMFWETQEIIRQNVSINIPNHFYCWLGDMYASTASVAIRRQVDANPNSISFLNLLTTVKNNPSILSRTQYKTLFVNSSFPESYQDECYDKFVGNGHNSPNPHAIGVEIQALKDKTDILRKHVNKRVAHYDQGQTIGIPTFQDVDDAIDYLEVYNTPQKLDIEIRCKIAVQRSSNEEAEQDKLYDGIQSESSFRSVQRTANDQ